MFKTLGFAAVLVASSALFTASAFACDCKPLPGPEAGLEQADAVFEGSVLERAKEDGSLEVTLLVTRTWKGVDENTVTLTTAGSTAACGFTFEENGTYLVYAKASESGDELRVNACSRTKLMSAAKEDLKALGEGTKVQSNGHAYFDPNSGGCSLAHGNAKSSTSAGLMLLAFGLWLARRRRA